MSRRRARRPAPAPVDVPTVAEARAALDELYAQLPPIQCKGLCRDSCYNVDASQLERDRIAERGVQLPEPVPGRVWLRLAEGARAAAGDAATGNGPTDGSLPPCPALSTLGTCRVYDVRPLMCRAFGMVPTSQVDPHRGPMMCDHGCIPEGVMSLADYVAALADVERLSRLVTGVARTPGVARTEESHR